MTLSNVRINFNFTSGLFYVARKLIKNGRAIMPRSLLFRTQKTETQNAKY